MLYPIARGTSPQIEGFPPSPKGTPTDHPPSSDARGKTYQVNPQGIECYRILLYDVMQQPGSADIAIKRARANKQKGLTLPADIMQRLNLH